MHGLKTLLFLGTLLSGSFLICRALLAAEIRPWLDYRFAVVVPIVAVGLLISSVWIYYGAILAAMAILPRSRFDAIGLYIFLALLLPLVTFDASVGSTVILRLTGAMVAAAGLVFAFRFPARKERSSAGHSITYVVAMFLLLQTVIAARIDGTNAMVLARGFITVSLTVGLPFVLLITAPDRTATIRKPVFYVIAAGVILSLLASFEMLRHWPMYQTIETNLGTFIGVSRTLALRGGLLRAAGPFFESTTFGLFLALATLFTVSMRSLFRSPLTYSIAIAVNLLGCFSTLSRNAWIGVAVGVIALGLYRGRFGKAVGMAALLGTAAAVLFIASPDSGRIASLLGKGNTGAAGTTAYRNDLLPASVPLIKNRPIFGTPFDRVKVLLRPSMRSGSVSVDYVNSYLYFLVTSGIVGLLIFCAYVFLPIILLLRIRSRVHAWEMEAMTALFSAQIAFAAMLAGTSFFERVPLFSILLVALTRRAIADAGRAPATSERRVWQSPVPGLRIVSPAQPVLAPLELKRAAK